MQNVEVKTPVRIMLVDDHSLVRGGLQRMIEREPGLAVMGEFSTADEALRAVRGDEPDMCIIDISLPGISGIELTQQIVALHPQCRVLILSVYEETTYARRAFTAGARGYVMKHERSDTIMEAVRRVARGEYFLSPGMQQLSAQILASGQAGDADEVAAVLTNRELEILHLLGKGLTTSQIAEQLNRSVKTVDAHRQALRIKLKLSNTAILTAFAARWVQQQEVSPPEEGNK